MSTHREDQLLNRYWAQRGGTLIRELVLRPSRRRADGVIDLDGPASDVRGSRLWNTPMQDIVGGKNLVCVEVKPACRKLDCAAIGQLLCAVDLLKPHNPANLEGVILAGIDEPHLRDVAQWLGFEVITERQQSPSARQPAYHNISRKPRSKRQAIAHRKIRSLHERFGGTLYTDVYLSPESGKNSRIDAILDPHGKSEHINRPRAELLESKKELVGIVARNWDGRVDRPTTGKAVCAKRLIETHFQPETVRVVICAQGSDPNHKVTLDGHGIEIIPC